MIINSTLSGPSARKVGQRGMRPTGRSRTKDATRARSGRQLMIQEGAQIARRALLRSGCRRQGEQCGFVRINAPSDPTGVDPAWADRALLACGQLRAWRHSRTRVHCIRSARVRAGR
jgi:hypothetical protein